MDKSLCLRSGALDIPICHVSLSVSAAVDLTAPGSSVTPGLPVQSAVLSRVQQSPTLRAPRQPATSPRPGPGRQVGHRRTSDAELGAIQRRNPIRSAPRRLKAVSKRRQLLLVRYGQLLTSPAAGHCGPFLAAGGGRCALPALRCQSPPDWHSALSRSPPAIVPPDMQIFLGVVD